MVGERMMWAAVIYGAGFASAVVVGARNGEQVADREQAMLDACDELARDDREVCMSRVDVLADALRALGERCVLAVPDVDNLRVQRMPKGLVP
jgi:hypothetical protein